MDEYIKKAIVGFNGNGFCEGYYQGNSYIAVIKKENIVLFSNEVITKMSQKYRDGYITEINVEELDDLVKSKMFAVYKGNEYRVQMVGKRLSDLELLARNGCEREDYELGFEDNIHERVTHKIVSKEDIESIRVERESILHKYK